MNAVVELSSPFKPSGVRNERKVPRWTSWKDLAPLATQKTQLLTYFVQSEAKKQEQKEAENTSRKTGKLLGPCAAFILISNTKSKGGNVNF